MPEMICPTCHKPISAAESAAFCPFCGAKLAKEKSGPDLSRVMAQENPVKKHEMLLKLKAEYPDSLKVAEEILHLGRLYDRGKRGVDFSIIKCYVLNVYLEPETIKKDKLAALRQEIFSHPDLDICLRLCDDQEAFLRRYLERLSEEFVRLFLRGSTQYMHAFFGFRNENKASKYLAVPAASMLKMMAGDTNLTNRQRSLLMQAFYAGYARQMNGETGALDDLLKTHHVEIQ